LCGSKKKQINIKFYSGFITNLVVFNSGQSHAFMTLMTHVSAISEVAALTENKKRL
jgi:hypothetical protein